MKVSVVFSRPMGELTGPSGVMSKFLANRSIFENGGIDDFNVFTPEASGRIEHSASANRTLKSKVNKVISDTMRKSAIGSYLLVKKNRFGFAKKSIAQYVSLGRKDDVIIFNSLIDCYEYLELVNWHTEAKIILTMRTSGDNWEMFYFTYPNLKNSMTANRLNKIEKRTCDFCDALVFVSDHSKNVFLSKYPEYQNKTHVVKNGAPWLDYVDSERMFNSLNLITVGTVDTRKNQIAAIRCLERINDPSITLTIVGGGYKLEEWKKYSIEKGLQNQVIFTGPRTDVPELLNKANAFIMTSFNEGLPNAGIEAMRSGLALIMTDAGGNAELVDGNGIVVTTNEKDIECAIRSFAGDLKKVEEFGKKSREFYESTYHVEKMMKNYLKLIIEVYNN